MKNSLESMLMAGPNFESARPAGHIFVSGFDESDLEDFTIQLMIAESDPNVNTIFLWVSSYGGETYSAFAMVDLLKTVQKSLFTIAYGKAMSSGCLLVAAGPKGCRFAAPNSYMMLHEASGGTYGKTQDVIQQAGDLKQVNDRYLALIADFTGKSMNSIYKQLKSIHNTDLILTADQALKFGLVDHIGIPKQVTMPQMPRTQVGIFGRQARPVKKKKSRK